VIEPTFTSPLEPEYSAPGGPWFGQTVDRLLAEMPSRPDLLVTDRGVWSSDELRARVQTVAGGLRARGVHRGDAVAWQLPNCIEAVVLYWATWWLGAVAVPLHQQLTAREVDAGLAQFDPGTQFVAPDERETLLDVLAGDPVTVPTGAPGDVAVILTTSGSSGRPKSVIHTQRTLAYKARQFPWVHGTGPADAVLMPAPLASGAGLLHGVLHPVASGAKGVIMETWDPAHALELVRSQRVTMLFGPPVFAQGIASAPGFTREAGASVRLVSSGGTTITEDFARAMADAFGAVVKRTYGSTEAPIVASSFPGDPVERGWTTDGRVVPVAELQLRDPISGVVDPDATEGELWLRGPELAEGYLDREQTEAAFVDGWFRTGDVALVDDGWFRVTGRSADIIIRGGANISASEVEGVLERHPAIHQAVVIGYPDDVYGERIGAFVVADEAIDRQRCVEWFAEYGLAKYKVPDRVIVVDSIPVLATFQKPDRNALREQMAREVAGEG
jgi:acyl-CoA synthetase (AMP-forming)/AMP-acid ligase II